MSTFNTFIIFIDNNGWYRKEKVGKVAKFLSRQLIPATFFSFKVTDFLWKEAIYILYLEWTNNVELIFWISNTISRKMWQSQPKNILVRTCVFVDSFWPKSFCRCWRRIQNPAKHLRGRKLFLQNVPKKL